MSADDSHDHDGGLAADLDLIGRRLLARRSALALLGGAVAGLPLISSASAATCVAYAKETAGPYPADGTNRSSGETSNVLTASGVKRRDIRPSFLSTTTVAAGVKTTLKLTVVDANDSCSPLAGCAVYLWHCDRDGNYSLYTAPEESYLRGVQVANKEGVLSFVTIFPGCYSGRWPHIHLEVYASLKKAKSGASPLLTSQLALPAKVCKQVYAKASGYSSSTRNFARTSLKSDNVFGDDTSAQVSAMTPSFSGSVSSGSFIATAQIGVPV